MDTVVDCPRWQKISPVEVLKSHKYLPSGSSSVKTFQGIEVKINLQYLAPFAFIALFVAQSFYVLASAGFKYDEMSPAMDALWTHRFIPSVIYFQGDVVINIALTLELFTFGRLLFDPLLPVKHRIYAIQKDEDEGAGPKAFVLILSNKSKRIFSLVFIITDFKCYNFSFSLVLPQKVSEPIMRFRTATKRTFKYLLTFLVLELLGYFYYSLVRLNLSSSSATPTDWFLLFYLPLVTFYGIYGATSVFIYFILAIKYIQIQQRYFYFKMLKLNGYLLRLKTEGLVLHNRTSVLLQFYGIKRQILGLLRQMEALNGFWSPYITICFMGHVAMCCFLLIRFFQKAVHLGWEDSLTLLVFALTFGNILIFICYICSTIVYVNVLLFKEFVRFNSLLGAVSVGGGGGGGIGQNVSDLLLVKFNNFFYKFINFLNFLAEQNSGQLQRFANGHQTGEQSAH